ncbi:MAG: EndoU domain-containing protein [Candidatus Dormiibacterota bacterium]
MPADASDRSVEGRVAALQRAVVRRVLAGLCDRHGRLAGFHDTRGGVTPPGRRRTRDVHEYIAGLPAERQELASHVLLGGFNKWGDPVGFHHAPNGVAPPGRRIDQVLERLPNGTYSARVSFWDPQRGWVRKPDPHTMFPDEWTPEEVIGAGLDAYEHRVRTWEAQTRRRRWTGISRSVRIAGHDRHDRSGPATFYPNEEHER